MEEIQVSAAKEEKKEPTMKTIVDINSKQILYFTIAFFIISGKYSFISIIFIFFSGISPRTSYS